MNSKPLSDICSKCNRNFEVGEGRYLFSDGVYCIDCYELPLSVRPSRPKLAANKQRKKATDRHRDAAI